MSKIELIEFTDKKDNYELMYKWCSQEFIYEWFEQRKISLEEIENKYKNKLLENQQHLFFINYNEEDCIEVIEYTDGDRVKTIKIGNVNLSGVEVRSLLGLRSANFSVEISTDTIKFTVKGYRPWSWNESNRS